MLVLTLATLVRLLLLLVVLMFAFVVGTADPGDVACDGSHLTFSSWPIRSSADITPPSTSEVVPAGLVAALPWATDSLRARSARHRRATASFAQPLPVVQWKWSYKYLQVGAEGAG